MKEKKEVLVNFGKKVKLFRSNKNFSQEDLAFKAELHRTYIGMIERAEKNITLINIEKIANALDVNIKDFFMNGFQNEEELLQAFNKPFNSLTDNLKNAILVINNNRIPNSLSSKKYGGISKPDLSIIIDNIEYFISVKKGSGNSVHQELIEDFIKFLTKKFGENISVFNDLRHFIWGDNTLIGNGVVSDRISASEYKKKFPLKVQNIQSYFDDKKELLLERFLVTGRDSSEGKIDYLLYGDVNECTVVSAEDLLNFALNVNKKSISIGVLNFQAWNRNINGGHLSEKKRGQIQLKWGTLKDDIQNI